ncbi:MAG: tetratricopeptide repeat protein [Candidatus Aminicenantales bacterium]
MRKNAAATFVFAVLAAFLLSACPARRPINQLEFGVWAAEKDLWEEAIFRWKKALQENPTSVAAHNNLAIAYEKKGLWEDARKEYEAALKLAPNNSWVKANYKSFQANLESAEKEKRAKEEKKKKDDKSS